MSSLPRSSGDLLADRRADYAEMLFADGEARAAAEVMSGALEIAPGWALGWFRLGEFHEAAGDAKAAVTAWRMARRLDPEDHAGATLKLVLAGAEPPAETPPSAFVEALFDQYADRFDASLTGALGYRAPELLDAAIRRVAPGWRFARAVDLGCGTGLMGARLRPICDDLEGHDISAQMLRKAKAKGIYDRLVKSDLQTLSLPAERADLVTAADVFMYIGALERVFTTVAAGLTAGGLFGFTVETPEADEGFALRVTRRYAHSLDYVAAALVAASLEMIAAVEAVLRQDRGQPVHGLVVLATPRRR